MSREKAVDLFWTGTFAFPSLGTTSPVALDIASNGSYTGTINDASFGLANIEGNINLNSLAVNAAWVYVSNNVGFTGTGQASLGNTGKMTWTLAAQFLGSVPEGNVTVTLNKQ